MQNLSKMNSENIIELFGDVGGEQDVFPMCEGRVEVEMTVPNETVMVNLTREFFALSDIDEKDDESRGLAMLSMVCKYGHYFVVGQALTSEQFNVGYRKSNGDERVAIQGYIQDKIVEWMGGAEEDEGGVEAQKKS